MRLHERALKSKCHIEFPQQITLLFHKRTSVFQKYNTVTEIN